LWEENYKADFREDSWSKIDKRLSEFDVLSKEWAWQTPIRNSYARRWALIELDVISAMAFNLTLDELISIYSITFPMMQQYEDETFYDQKGNIVFTVNRGLTGVGLSRNEWNSIKDLDAGKTFEYEIDPKRSELYGGKKVTYHAPFDKCDRVEDYKVAWAWFERVFDEKS
jgi:hypothetical protein